MRDPLRPIPSPSTSRAYWERVSPPPAPARRLSPRGPEEAASYDPARILRDHEPDALGLDRRTFSRTRALGEAPHRGAQEQQETDLGARVAVSMHESLRGVLGLCTTHGWALVESLTLAPQGMLVRHIEATDRDLTCETRVEINRALVSLSPVMGAPLRHRHGAPWRDARGRTSSPLANIGTHLLGERVVADASNWANGAQARGPRGSENLQVTLVLPPRGGAQSRPRITGLAQLPQVEGRLTALNDPDPRVLGVALDPRAVSELRLHLRAGRSR